MQYEFEQRPNVAELISDYNLDADNPQEAILRVSRAYMTRRCLWQNKNDRMTKDYPGANPWQNASDLEVPVADTRTTKLTALCMNALQNAQVLAVPRNAMVKEKAASRAAFVKYMMDTWTPNAEKEKEAAIQSLFERGVAVTEVGWKTQTRKAKEIIDLDLLIQAAEESEELAFFIEQVMDETREEEAAQRLSNDYGIRIGAARKAVRNLRSSGIAEITVVKNDIDHPVCSSLEWLNQVIFPIYTGRQEPDRVHVRKFMTTQDLIQNVENRGFDKEVVDDIIENKRFYTVSEMLSPSRGGAPFVSDLELISNQNLNVVEVICRYSKLVDRTDGSIAIYQTFFSPGQNQDMRPIKHELLEGWDRFPLVWTRLEEDSALLVQSRSICSKLRGNQFQQKVIRDSNQDQRSITINPPRAYPSGRPPSSWGAGATFAERASERGLNRVIQMPETSLQNLRVEQYLDEEADKIAGLRVGRPEDMVYQQFLVNKVLAHFSKVAELMLKCYHDNAKDDTIYFRVTGSPDTYRFDKSMNAENVDVQLLYDVRTMDGSYLDKLAERLKIISSMDSGRRINMNNLVDVATNIFLPSYAGYLLQDSEESRRDILQRVANDLALIWSGQEPGPQQNAAQTALPYLQEYVQKPSVQERIASDMEYAENLQRYIAYYEHDEVQQTNAITGALGERPGELEGINNA